MGRLSEGWGRYLPASSSGGGGRRVSVDPALPYDERRAEFQQIIRNYDSSNQIGAAYAASRIHDSQEYAQRELERLRKAQERGVNIPQEYIEELERAANPSFKDRLLEKAAPVFKVLELFDRPRQVLTLFAKDILQADEKHGTEIDLDNYAQVLRGDKAELIRDLGAKVVGEDGFLGMSTVLDDLGWEKTDNFFNKVARGVVTFGGEVVTDPLTFVSGGALGLAKAQRGRFLKRAVDNQVGPLQKALRDKAADEFGEIGELGRVMYDKGLKKATVINDEIIDEIAEALQRGADNEAGVLAKYGIDLDLPDELTDAARGDYFDAVLDEVKEAVWEDATAKAAVETGDEIFNQAAPALMAKDWLDDTLKMVADSKGAPDVLKGGVRLQIPFYTQITGKSKGSIAGTRGLGRKISNAIFGHSSEYARAAKRGPKGATGVRRVLEETVAPNLYQRWTEAAMRFSDDGFWRQVMRGENPNASASLRAQQVALDAVDRLSRQSGSREVAKATVGFQKEVVTSRMSDDDLQIIMRAMGQIMETAPNATIQEVTDFLHDAVVREGGSLTTMPPGVVEAAKKWMVLQRRYMDYMFKEARAAGVIEGDGLQNYVPHMLNGETNEYLDILVNRGVAPSGVDSLGDQILRALIEARRRAKVEGETVAGEAAGAAQRTIGRTVTRTSGDQSIPFVIGDTVLHDKNLFGADGLTVKELNELIRDSMNRIEDDFGIRPPKQGKGNVPFMVYNENPMVTIQAYGHDMMMAVTERKLLQTLENLGLIEDSARFLNQQTLANSLAEKLGKYGKDIVAVEQARVGRMIDEKMTMLRNLDGGPEAFLDDVDMTVVKIGEHSVEIPTAALEANRKLKSRLEKITNKEAATREVQARADAFYLDAFNALRKQGVPRATAAELAQQETRREINEVLKLAKREWKGMTRRMVAHHKIMLATEHADKKAAAEAGWREAAAKADAVEAKANKLLESIDEEVAVRRKAREDAVSPLENDAAMGAHVIRMQRAMASDVREIADNMMELGNIEEARMLGVIADQLELPEGAQLELTVLGSDLRGIVEHVTYQHRQQLDDYLGSPAAVAQADEFMDQAEWYEGNILDPGDWGPERYADARYVFHGTTQPSAAQLAHSRHWGGGGLTANPVRATMYANDGWVMVFDLEDMPVHVRESVRAGQDIEDRSAYLMLKGFDDTETAGFPRPVAVLPAGAVREAAIRRAQDPEALAKVARTLASNQMWEVFNRPVPNALRGADQEGFYRLVDRAATDPLFGGSEEFEDAIFELFGNSAMARLDDFVERTSEFVEKFREDLVHHRGVARKGQVEPYEGKPFDLRQSKVRKEVLSVWHDEWAPKARKGAPVRTVGEPVSAPWVPAAEAVNGDAFAKVYRDLHGDAWQDIKAFDDTALQYDFPSFLDRAGEFFEMQFIRLQAGKVTGEMQDLMNAAQRSLRARGLGEEFPVWAVDNEHGFARLSLVPVEGATVYTIRRDDVLIDWGSLFPEDLNLLDDAARARRHHVMADVAKLRVADEVATTGATGMPPKVALHGMRPENMTYERMLAIFGDHEIAEQAYADLFRRLDQVVAPNMDNLERIANMRAAAAGWFGLGGAAAPGQRVGLMTAALNVFKDPQRFGELFSHPDVQQWWSKTMRDQFGTEWTYARQHVALDPATRTWYVVPPGTADSVEVTVPHQVHRNAEKRPMYTRRQFEKEARRHGKTPTELRMLAGRHARSRTLTREAREALPAETRRQLDEADEFFDGETKLFNTVMGYGDELTQGLERAQRLLEEAAALRGEGARNYDELLGRKRDPVSADAVRQTVERAVDDMRAQWRLNPDMALGATVGVRSGMGATRGVAVGTGLGEVRFAIPEGGITEELFDAIKLEVNDWVRATPEVLERPAAHVGIWVDSSNGEVVMEVAGVVDSVATARRRGMDFDQDAVFNLATGDEISLPTTRSKFEAQAKQAAKGVRGADVLEQIDGQLRGNRFDVAEALMLVPKNSSLLREVLGDLEYDNLLDIIQTERVIALNMVPGDEALRAARQARKALGDRDSARQAAIELREEGIRLQRAATTEEMGQVLEAQTKLGEIIQDIIGVGLDAERRLGDESLYPRVEGRVTLEASEQLKARAEEARRLAHELGWDKTAKALDEILDEPPYALMGTAGTGPAVHNFAVFGVGGTATQYKSTSGAVAHMIEQTISRWQTLTTPEGFELFAKQLNWVGRAWKTMATVARVNFHPRNLIGGVFNNMAADVRLADYAWVRHRGMQYQRLVREGATDAEMLEFFGPEDWKVFTDARKEGVLGEGFARGDLDVELPRGRGAVRLRDRVNPGSAEFVPSKYFGAPAMRNIEDFLRLSAFRRWHGQLGSAGARDMVNMVHFNYRQLSDMDMKFKKFVPFWVWTKNNIGLQMRLMMERPDIMVRYGHMMRAIDDNFGGEDDDWPMNQYRSPFAADIGIQLGNDQRWARLLFDPDLPITDLQVLDNPLSMEFVTNSMANMLGPHITMPLSVGEQNDWGSANAPIGWNSVLKALDAVGLYDARITAQGDAQVGYGTRNMMRTALPIISEYAGIAGLRNDPEALLRQGITTDDGVSLGERALGGLTFLGRGFGVQATTPNDARVAAYMADQRTREIVEELRLAGLLSPQDFESNAATREAMEFLSNR